MPSRVRKLPVFYLFAGADVITARGFFPHAPRVLLTSGLPFGDVPPPLLRPNPAALAARCTRPRPSRRARAQVGCFLHAPCATSMRRAALAALDNWQWHGFAWSEEKHLDRVLVTEPRLLNEHNATFGVAPLILTCLHAFGATLEAIDRRPGTNLVTLALSDGTRVSYQALGLGWRPLDEDLADLDRMLEPSPPPVRAPASLYAPPPPPAAAFVTVIKAAALGWAYLRQRALYTHVLARSAAALTDETGFAPTCYDPGEWKLTGYGSFEALEQSYADLNIAEAWHRVGRAGNPLHNASLQWRDEMRAFFHADRPALPFVFGYGTHLRGPGAHGVLLAAWRHAHG